MHCPVCGLSRPGDSGWCPHCGAAAGPSGPAEEFLPLRALAGILTVLLAVVVTASLTLLGIRLTGPGTSRWQGGYLVRQAGKTADIVIVVLGILFVVWFRRARINAEHRGWRQRRARAWTFWGWLVPIANLWIRSSSWVTSGGPAGQPAAAARPRGCPCCGGQAGCSAESQSETTGPGNTSCRTCPPAPGRPASASLRSPVRR